MQDIESLKQAEQVWVRSLTTADAELLATLIDDRFTFIGPDAQVQDRVAYLAGYEGMTAAGIIVDGAIRDAVGMVADSPPTFARSTCIRIFGSTGPGAINVPVSCGGVTVNPGDIILGDRDGVVVVPREDAARVADLADAHLEGELARMKAVEEGGSVTDVFQLAPKLARWES